MQTELVRALRPRAALTHSAQFPIPVCIRKHPPFQRNGSISRGGGKEVLRLAKKHLKRRESFTVETTLSGKNYLQMMQYTRGIDQGFEVVLIYIGTERVEINLARIAKRVRAGGHDVLEIDVRRRYLRSLQICPLPPELLTELYSSTTPMIWVTSPLAYSARIASVVRAAPRVGW